MITELRIADLGVISEAAVEPHPGLTVVTGETGAGKTMIVTGLGLLLGGRTDPSAVRHGSERARVEGRFGCADPALVTAVTEAGGEIEDGELLVARQVTASGRSRAFLGGAQVPAPVCARVIETLIAIHGQSEQVRLRSGDRQRELLDRFAGDSVAGPLEAYRQAWAERRAASAELDRLRAEAQSRAREIDLLRFGLIEIEAVTPEPGEDTRLAAEATRLQSADDLRLVAEQALVAVAGAEDEAGGALSDVTAARKAVERAVDPVLADLGHRLAEAGYALAEIAGDLAGYLGDLEAEPGRLEQIAARRSRLSGLTRKYGSSVDEVLAWASTAADRLTELEGGDDRIELLEARVGELDAELDSLAGAISAARRTAAAAFAERVQPELVALALPYARLIFDIQLGELGPHGADQVELLFSANPGSEPQSLAKVASGGELSRIRLALEVVLAEGQSAATLVFDEVDAGVGGRVAVEIGRRLAHLARHSQVIVVTHLAQVAAFADRHYVVVKSDDGQVTTSGVQLVSDSERAAELARMMAGLETTEVALAHAGELVELAESVRGSA